MSEDLGRPPSTAERWLGAVLGLAAFVVCTAGALALYRLHIEHSAVMLSLLAVFAAVSGFIFLRVVFTRPQALRNPAANATGWFLVIVGGVVAAVSIGAPGFSADRVKLLGPALLLVAYGARQLGRTRK